MLFSFQDLVRFFGLKPKAEEKEVTSGHFFMLWFEFCADFKARWKRENKTMSKDRYVMHLQLTCMQLEMCRIFLLSSGCSKSSTASEVRRFLCCWGAVSERWGQLFWPHSVFRQMSQIIFFCWLFGFFLQTERGSTVSQENHWRKEGGDQKDQP